MCSLTIECVLLGESGERRVRDSSDARGNGTYVLACLDLRPALPRSIDANVQVSSCICMRVCIRAYAIWIHAVCVNVVCMCWQYMLCV